MIEKNMEFPLSLGLQKTGLPLIISSDNLCFLIDTGSTHNTLFGFVYEHFKDRFKVLEERCNIIGIDGVQHEAPTIEATFNFEGMNYTSSFAVLDASEAVMQVQEETGVQIHGVLGTQFLVENKWIVDFDKLIVRDENL